MTKFELYYSGTYKIAPVEVVAETTHTITIDRGGRESKTYKNSAYAPELYDTAEEARAAGIKKAAGVVEALEKKLARARGDLALLIGD